MVYNALRDLLESIDSNSIVMFMFHGNYVSVHKALRSILLVLLFLFLSISVAWAQIHSFID